MTQTNRVQVALVRETTAGTTPATPRMRLVRITGESLTYSPSFVDTEEIRPDRMQPDPIEVFQGAGGSLNFELSYPVDNYPLSDLLRSAFYGTWANAPAFDNDLTADSVITDAGTALNTYAVTSGGASVKAGHLVRATGFTNAANNQIFKVASSSATTIVGTTLGLTAETAPPGTARLKVVGFQGASGDITATATGLGATALDFTTLGLAVGQWIKIGGTAAGDKFATAALNDWMRITAIAATALTLDNRPTGWTTDTGTGKTIKVWFGDQIKNGTTQTSFSVEKGFLGQTTPTYILQRGMVVNTLPLAIQSKQRITGQAMFVGMGGSESTTAQDAAPDAVTTGRIIAANANVGRIAENGSALGSPNWARSLNFSINNNLRTVDDATSMNPQAVREGECTVTGTIETYFGDDTLLAKLYAGTATAINCRVQKDSQALVFQFPRVTYRQGDPQAQARNQDVMLSLPFSASYDSTTAAHVLLDRLEYYE